MLRVQCRPWSDLLVMTSFGDFFFIISLSLRQPDIIMNCVILVNLHVVMNSAIPNKKLKLNKFDLKSPFLMTAVIFVYTACFFYIFLGLILEL